MKTSRLKFAGTLVLSNLLVVAMLGIPMSAMGKDKAGQKVFVAAPLPDIGGYMVIATMKDSNKIVTLQLNAGLVCIENAYSVGASSFSLRDGSSAAFNCWEINKAPAKLQELVFSRK